LEFLSNNIVWIALVAVAIFLVILYNRLVALRQTRRNAFSDIDVQLKQRYDLVPQLVNTVKGYAKHEKELLEKVTEARANAMKIDGAGADRSNAESVLSGAMMQLFAVAENYPDLKADGNFAKLQEELSDVENKIAAARRFFNNATSELNTACEQFPSVIVARMFGFQQESFFEIPEGQDAAKEPVAVNF
jgi:LemA protein